MSTEGDWSKDPIWRQFAQHTRAEMLPKLIQSAVSISVYPTEGVGDVKYWVELGASIMLDKPILVLVEPGAKIPKKLRHVADLVVEADITSPLGQAEFSERIQRFIEEHEAA